MGSTIGGRGGDDDDDEDGSDDDSYGIDDSDDSNGDSCRIIIGGTGRDDADSAGRPETATISRVGQSARATRGADASCLWQRR